MYIGYLSRLGNAKSHSVPSKTRNANMKESVFIGCVAGENLSLIHDKQQNL